MTPLRGYVLVEQVEEEATTASGRLIIPDAVKEKQAKGRVVKLGVDYMNEHGIVWPWDIKEGDVIWYKRFAGEPVKEDGKEYVLVHNSNGNLMAIV